MENDQWFHVLHRLSFLLILSFLDFGEVSGHAVAMVIRAAKCKASMGEKRQETLPIFSLLKLNGEGAKSKITQADPLGKLAVRSALQQKEFRQSNAHDLPRYQPGARGFHPQHPPPAVASGGKCCRHSSRQRLSRQLWTPTFAGESGTQGMRGCWDLGSSSVSPACPSLSVLLGDEL